MSVTCACSRPLADNAYLCSHCARHLARLIGDVTALVSELETTRSRQSRTGSAGVGVTSRASERPLPWDERAARATARLRLALVNAARVVLEQHPGRPGGPRCPDCEHPSCLAYQLQAPVNTLPAVAGWLLHHIEWLRHQPEAPDIRTNIEGAIGRVRRVIDRRPDVSYLGPCGEQVDPWTDPRGKTRTDCPAELYANAGDQHVDCRGCTAQHNVELRKAWLLAAAEQQLETASVISQAVSRLGQTVTASMIRGWAFRGRLAAHTADVDGSPLYRVGDVLDLLASEAARAEQLEQRRLGKTRHTG